MDMLAGKNVRQFGSSLELDHLAKFLQECTVTPSEPYERDPSYSIDHLLESSGNWPSKEIATDLP
jgi:hypothetical protein